MKKEATLIISLLFMQLFMYAQVPNYQIINGGFELWETITYNSQSITEPVQWNGFKTGVAPEGSSLAYAMLALPIQFAASSDIRPGSLGIKSIKTWSLDLSWVPGHANLVANGLFTSGQVHMSSASYTDPNNYYGTLLENAAFSMPLSAMPDSICFWAKYETPATAQNAAIHVYIHDSSNVHDPVPAAMNANVVASAIYEWQRGNQQWQQHKVAFNYASWTNQNPACILITFFSSPVWGVGTPNDTLYVDDIELIYNCLLNDLQVDGTTLPAFNSQVTHYPVPFCQPLTAENIPVITASAASPHATVSITQPTLQNPTATIIVTHGDNSKTYTIHFSSNNVFSVHNAQLCQGYPYNGYGFNIPNPVTQQYSRTIPREIPSDCDSTIYLNLTVFPDYTGAQAITKYDTVCQGAGYSRYGFSLTASQTNVPGTVTRTQNGVTSNGCDSTTRLLLYVNSKNSIQISDRVCQGTAYQKQGFDIPASSLQRVGNHTATLTLSNRFGCDSAVTLQLAIDSVYHTVLYDQVCSGDPYIKHGFNLPDNLTAGTFTYERSLASKKGCDSLVSLHLTVNPVKTTGFCDTVCQNSSYQQHGFDFSAARTAEAGLLYDTLFLQTTQGCDSIVTLQLLVNPQYHPTPLYVQLCGSEVYDFYGQPLNSADTYTHTLTSQHGCDSVISLVLTVKPEYTTLLSDTVCEKEPYNRHGFALSATETAQAGLLRDTLFLQTVHSCDSTVVLSLTIHPSYSGAQAVTKHDTICQGAEYNRYGFTLSAAETNTAGTINRTLNLLSSNGCDSVVMLNLFINPVKDTHIYDTVCANSDYQQYGFDVHATGNGTTLYTQSLQTVNQCDSNVTLHLFVHPEYHPAPLYVQLCGSEVYDFYGQSLSSADTYTHTLTSQHDCDSVITLVLTVEPEYTTLLTDSICEKEIYNLHGFALSATETAQAGLLRDTLFLQTVHGCDSVVVLNLTIHPSYSGAQTITKYDTICQETEYNRYGFSLSTAETNTVGTINRTLNLLSSNGCDSIVMLYLFINPVKNTHIYDSICANSDYQQYGFDVHATGSGTTLYTQLLQTVNQCDSNVTLHLFVHPEYHPAPLYFKLCGSAVYDFYGQDLDSAGIYTHTLTSKNGCDSVISLHLETGDEFRNVITASICEGETYSQHGFSKSTSGIDSITYTANNGCDSVVVLSLTVHPSYSGAQGITKYDTTCQGAEYNRYGFTLSTAETNTVGTINRTLNLLSSNGCDSVVMLNLLINPVKNTHIYDTVCANSDYQQYGFDVHATGSGTTLYTQSLQTVNQCDSIVTLHLFVHPEYHPTPLYVQLCGSAVYHFYGQDLSSADTYTHTLTSQHGCDSVITLVLTVEPEYHILLTDSVCEKEIYNLHGFTLSATETAQAGLVRDTLFLQTVHGCDSIVMLNLTVFPSYSGAQAITLYDTICEGAGYNDYGFSLTDVETNTAGTVNRTHNNLLTVNGCDSVVHLALYVKPKHSIQLYDSVCQGSDYQQYGFNISAATLQFVEKDTATLNLTNRFGCDSLVTLYLTVNPVKTTVFNEEICLNSEYQQHGFSFSSSETAQAGMLRDTLFLQTIHDCDSTVILNLTIHPLYADTLTVTVCDSYFWEGTTYTAGDTYTQHYQSQYGCDSAKTLHLTLNYTSPVTHFNDTVRGGYTYNKHGFTITAPQVSNNILDTLHLTNAAACDSTVTLILHVIPMQYDTVLHYYCQRDSFLWKDSTYSEPHSFTDTLFEDNVTRIITTHFIENEAPVHQFSISDCNPYPWGDSLYSTSGSYTRIYPLPTGCDSTVTLHFTRFSPYLFEESHSICESEAVYEWHGKQLTESGIYWDSLTTVNGCDSVYQLLFTVYPSYFIDYQRTFCDNSTYSWRGQPITETGIYWDSLTTIDGCDSLYRLEAVVNPTYLRITDTTICATETLTWQGETYTESGNYTTAYSATTGCDSIFKLNLTVLPIITLDSNRTICEGETVIWGDEIAQTTGTYTKYLANIWNCDTICRLFLTVNPVSQTDLYYTAAIGDTLDYEGFILIGDSMNEAGEYGLERVLTNQYGCDSTVRLQLTVSGIAEATMHNIHIYPNPASNHFIIENSQGMLKNVAVYDLTGRLIKQVQAPDSNSVLIAVNRWAKGIYIVKIDIGEAVLIRKIVIN